MNTLYTSRETLADLATITTKAAEISHALARTQLASASGTTETESNASTPDSKNSISMSIGGRIPSLNAIMAEQQLLTSRERRLLSLYDQVESFSRFPHAHLTRSRTFCNRPAATMKATPTPLMVAVRPELCTR